jgi:hypothetical protein
MKIANDISFFRKVFVWDFHLTFVVDVQMERFTRVSSFSYMISYGYD